GCRLIHPPLAQPEFHRARRTTSWHARRGPVETGRSAIPKASAAKLAVIPRARFVKPGQHVEVWGRSLVGPWLAGFRPFPRAPPASPPGAGPPTANSRPISYSRLFGAADHATSPGPTHEPSQG